MTSASDIMKNPAGNSTAGFDHGAAPAPIVDTNLPVDAGVRKLLNDLPGLVGAIDIAIKDTVGKPLGFMLMIFAEGAALHGQNCDVTLGQKAVIELAEKWKAEHAAAEAASPANEDVVDPTPAANEG